MARAGSKSSPRKAENKEQNNILQAMRASQSGVPAEQTREKREFEKLRNDATELQRIRNQ